MRAGVLELLQSHRGRPEGALAMIEQLANWMIAALFVALAMSCLCSALLGLVRDAQPVIADVFELACWVRSLFSRKGRG